MPNQVDIKVALAGQQAVAAGLREVTAGISGAGTRLAQIHQTGLALGNALPGVFGQLSGGLGGIGQAITATLAGAASLGAMLNALKEQDALGKLAQRAAASVEQMARLTYAARMEDVEVGNLTMSLKEYAEWLKKNGQGSANLLEETLKLSDQFAAMPDGIEKTTMATDRFGRSGGAMIPLLNKGSEGLRAMFAASDRLNPVTAAMSAAADEFGDNLDNLHEATKGVAGAFAHALIPAINPLLKIVTDLLADLRQFIQANPMVVTGIQAITSAVVAMGAAFAAVKLGGWFAALFGGLSGLREMGVAFQLLGSGAASLGLPALALGFAGVTAAIWSAIEAMRAWSALGKEKATQQALEAQNAALKASLMAGMPEAKRKEFERGLVAADEGAQGGMEAKRLPGLWRLNPFAAQEMTQARLVAQNNYLRDQARQQLGPGTDIPANPREPLDDAARAALAKRIRVAQEDAELRRADLDRAVVENQAAYDLKTRTLEEFLANEKRLTLEAHESERESLMQQGKVYEEVRRRELEVAASSSGEEKQRATKNAEEATQRIAELVNRRLKMEIELQTRLTKAAADGERQRQQDREQALQRQLQLQTELLRAQRESMALDRAATQVNFRLTDNQKRVTVIDSLKAERAEVDKLWSQWETELDQKARARRAAGIKEPSREEEMLQSKIDTGKSESRSLGGQIQQASAGPDPNSVNQQVLASTVQMLSQIGTVAQQVGRAFTTVIGGAIDGLQQGIAGLIQGTLTWGQALQNIGGSIMTSVINAISRMFAEWVVGRALAGAAELLWSGRETLAKLPSALLTSITSYGWAAVAGAAALGVAIAGLSGAFASGGLVPGAPSSTDNRVAAVASGEYIVRASSVAHYGPELFSALNNQRLPRDFAAPAEALPASGSLFAAGGAAAPSLASHDWSEGRAPGGPAAAPAPNVTVEPRFAVHTHDGPDNMMDYIRKNPDMEHYILDVVGKNWSRLSPG